VRRAEILERNFFGSIGVQIKELDQEVQVGRRKAFGTVGGQVVRRVSTYTNISIVF